MASHIGKDKNGEEIVFIEEDGMTYPAGTVSKMESGSFKSQLEMVRNLDIRTDDVLIVAFMKSGMHWLWEIVTMIVNDTTEFSKKHKENVMMDFRSKQRLAEVVSPRILNMHFPARYLPQQVLDKRRPIIHIRRNPKDVFVSFYNHYMSIPVYQHVENFSDFLSMMLGENGYYLKFPWYQYELEWENFAKDNPDYPILQLYYEDLKEDLESSVEKISDFLKANISHETICNIAQKCNIQTMREANNHFKESPCQSVMFRKGMVGDWKNWFTVAENEKMDEWLQKHLVDTELKFRYTL